MTKKSTLAKKLYCPACSNKSLVTIPYTGYLKFRCRTKNCAYVTTSYDYTELTRIQATQQALAISPTKTIPRRLDLGDTAWDNLSKMAHSFGWIRRINTISSPGVSTKHINRFIAALSNQTWHDTRPPGHQSTGIWYTNETPMRRTVSLNDYTLTALAEIAFKHKIPPRGIQAMLIDDRYYALAPDEAQYTKMQATYSNLTFAIAVLEAIGLRYLTPEVWPDAPLNLYKHPPGYGNGRRSTMNQDPLAKYTERLYV